MNSIAISIKNLQKNYGKNTILDIENLTIRKGDSFSLIGPNGAGKSTLLRIIGMLEHFNKGEITLLGTPLNPKKDNLLLRRRLAMVFQSPLMYKMSVRENIALGLTFRQMPRRLINEKVNTWMEKLNISHLSGHYGIKLSGGEARRVSIARALVTEPEILLLDEPFSDLDPITREKLIYELKSLLSKTNITTIFVTHLIDESFIFSNKIAVMFHGKILQCSSPEEIFNHPGDENIAAFVGIETIIEGTVIENIDSFATIKLSSGETIKAVTDIKENNSVRVCIRPENVVIEKENDKLTSNFRNSFTGKIKSLIPSGFYYKLELDCGFNLCSFVTKQSIEEIELTEGKTVKACFKATSVHVIKQ